MLSSKHRGTDLLTTKQVAEALGIGYEACKKRLQRQGIEPDEIIGRNNFYRPEVVEELTLTS